MKKIFIYYSLTGMGIGLIIIILGLYMIIGINRINKVD